jgi:hypothetical protein
MYWTLGPQYMKSEGPKLAHSTKDIQTPQKIQVEEMFPNLVVTIVLIQSQIKHYQ